MEDVVVGEGVVDAFKIVIGSLCVQIRPGLRVAILVALLVLVIALLLLIIMFMKYAGALVNPNGITVYSYKPYLVVKAVLGISASRIFS